MTQTELELIDEIAKFEHDPRKFALFSYPWGEGELKGEALRAWQIEVLSMIRDHLKDKKTRHQPLKISVASGHGVGKAQCLTSIVDTPSGVKTWGDLKPGDYLFAKSGKPTKILQRFDHKNKSMVRVTFDDGSYLDVCRDHLWSVRGRQERRKKVDGYRVLSTQEILDIGVLRSNGGAMAKQWEIPLQEPAQYNSKETDLHPYLVGVWLGDGHRGYPKYTKPSKEIADKIRGLGYTVNELSQNAKSIIGILDRFTDPVFQCHSYDRYIPDAYKYNSVANRMALLEGLLDTDGEAHASGSIGFSTTSKRLADDVVWLARSLGCKAFIQDKIKKPFYKGPNGEKLQGKDCYRITINAPFNPFTIPNKKLSYKPSEHRYLVRWIASIDPIPNADCMCVTVDAEDHLYQSSNFIVTHNTALISIICNWAMSTKEDTKAIVTANTDTQLKTKTGPEIGKWFRLAINSHWFKPNATSIHSIDPGHERSWRLDLIPWSENNTEAFAGAHNKGKRILIVFDEASAISDKIWEVTEGALTDEDTEIIWLAFGNPTRNTGRFRECFRRFKNMWKNLCIDSRDVEGTNKTLFDEWAAAYGVESDFFKIRVRGMFPSSSLKQFISTDDVDKAFGKHLTENNYSFAPKILTVDPAWEGDDETVIALRQGLAFKILASFPKNDNDVHVANAIARFEDQEKADAVFIDGGYGTGIVSVGRTLGRSWQLVWFQEKPIDPGYLNKRAEMWGLMKEWLKQGGAIPKDNLLYHDLIGPETVARLDGKIQLESKKDMKARGIPSPNRGDALALSFAYPVASKLLHSSNSVRKMNTEYDPLADN